jgi:hypothetical protein
MLLKEGSDGKSRKKTKQLLDDLKEKRIYWKLRGGGGGGGGGGLDRTLCRTRLGRGLWTCPSNE